jgi:selenocysteine-specific translation elongation factor
MVMPTRQQFDVLAIMINDVPVRSAKPGENVAVKLAGAGVENVQKG